MPQPDDAEQPGWFRRALAQPPEHWDVDVEGTRIHYRAWGDSGAPGLVLVHGGAAHSGWWDHVAPLLSSHRCMS
jgi:alpha-beta hydrolase superfamily lysophospholipase